MMRYIKAFNESRNIDDRLDSIIHNIKYLLVELNDIGFYNIDHRIDDDLRNGAMNFETIIQNIEIDKTFYINNEIIECFERISDYLHQEELYSYIAIYDSNGKFDYGDTFNVNYLKTLESYKVEMDSIILVVKLRQ